MRKAVCLLIAVVFLATLLVAQDSSKPAKEMTGTICNSACVVQQSNLPTCDLSCTDKSGDCVFVGDNGHVMKVDNPDKAMPAMNKKVKIKAEKIPSEKEREEAVRIMTLEQLGP